jgi:sugar phosphate permease
MKRVSNIALPLFICVLGSFFYVYDYFLAVSPSVMTKNLMNDFALDATSLGSLMAIFSLASTFFQIPAGLLLDRFGARKLLSLSVLISGIGALLFAEAHESWALGLGRLLMGVGSPFAFLGALYLVSRWFSHQYFGFASGALQLGAAIGSMIGGAPLAILVNAIGWREGLAWIGVATILLSVLFWGILRDGSRPSEDRRIRPCSLRSAFTMPKVWVITLIGFCSWVTVTGLGSLWGVPYLMKIYHLTNTEGGLFYLFFWLGLGFGSPLVGWFSDRIHSRRIPFLLCFSIGIVSCLFYMAGPVIPKSFMGVLLFFLGFVASTQSLTFAAAKDIVPAEHFGAISGLINLSAVLTGIVMQPLMGKLMDLHASFHREPTEDYSILDYQFSLLPILIFLVLGFLSAWILSNSEEKKRV